MTYQPSLTLLQGMEQKDFIEELISKTSLRSEGVKQALIEHYAHGYDSVLAYDTNGISQQQFQRGQKVLIEAYRKSDVNSNNIFKRAA